MDLTNLVTELDGLDVDSRYRVVIMTAQRARQLMHGSTSLVQSKFSKEITVAFQEALEGKLEYTIGPDARKALKEARHKELLPRPKAYPANVENDSEMKKDLNQYLEDSKSKLNIVEPPPKS